MALAQMISADEDSLVCDMAQYYHVLDYEQLPPERAAVLAWGLPEDSRIKRLISGSNYDINALLIAICADHLATLVWSKTKDAAKGRNRPESLYKKMTEKKKEPELKGFNSPEAFEAYRQRLIKENTNGK